MTAGLLIARALTNSTPRTKRPLTVRAEGARAISVEATPHTSISGTWGVWLAGGGHLRVSGQPQSAGERVIWALDDGQDSPREPVRAAWTGIAHRSPDDAGLTAIDDLVQTPAGMTPAWSIGKATRGHDLWAVHVHGAGSTRAGTLRGVLSAEEAAVPSLVVTYRNSMEGPRFGRGRSHLGYTETRDVEAALLHLEDAGARRFLLFGWSMGAQTVLPLAASQRWRERIVGVVLDSPALSWESTLRANLHAAHLPAALATSALPWIESARRARMVGLDEPVPVSRMDWVARAPEIVAPLLVHHGTADTSTPFSDAEKLVDAAPAGSLVATSAGHTVNWNVDPDRWNSATVQFLMSVL